MLVLVGMVTLRGLMQRQKLEPRCIMPMMIAKSNDFIGNTVFLALLIIYRTSDLESNVKFILVL